MRVWSLIAAILICVTTGGIGSIFTAGNSGTYYQELTRPSWAPPGWVFGPVWTLLYIMMGFSAWLVWLERGNPAVPVHAALWLFGIHLVFNAAWTGIFFGAKLPGWAFVEIVVLLVMIVASIVLFWRVRPLAAILLLPYLGWVIFAAYLNWSLWSLNQ